MWASQFAVFAGIGFEMFGGRGLLVDTLLWLYVWSDVDVFCWAVLSIIGDVSWVVLDVDVGELQCGEVGLMFWRVSSGLQ